MKKVLLLNSDWTPLNFVSSFRALNLLVKGRAEVICLGDSPSMWNERVSSPTTSYDVPATVRLTHRVRRKRVPPKFKKWVLFNRDDWQCQYCGIDLDWHTITVDHVVPRCRGGSTSWRNCVASCKKCNWSKGSRSLSDTGLVLRKKPVEPHVMDYWQYGKSAPWHPDWSMLLHRNTYRS